MGIISVHANTNEKANRVVLPERSHRVIIRPRVTKDRLFYLLCVQYFYI